MGSDNAIRYRLERQLGMTTSPLAHHNTPAQDDFYALNVGDFLTDSLFSDDVLAKIQQHLSQKKAQQQPWDENHQYRDQLAELVRIYAIENTLGVLGMTGAAGDDLYTGLACGLKPLFQAESVHLFLHATNATGQVFLHGVGNSLSLTGGTAAAGAERFPGVLSASHPWYSTMQNNTPCLWQDAHHNAILLIPLSLDGRPSGLLAVCRSTFTPFNTTPEATPALSPEIFGLAQTTAHLLQLALRLQQGIYKAQAMLAEPEAVLTTRTDQLQHLRAEITEDIAAVGLAQQEFVEALSVALDSRRADTRGHSKQVAFTARALAEAYGLNEKTVDTIYWAGLLGALGKMSLPESVLNKPTALSEDEWDALRHHPNLGVSMLAHVYFLADILPYVTYQYERWDGTGTPEGRKGNDIPLGSRLLALSDAYCAMRASRPYRTERMSHADTVGQLKQEAGSKWDPQAVETLAQLDEVDCWAVL